MCSNHMQVNLVKFTFYFLLFIFIAEDHFNEYIQHTLLTQKGEISQRRHGFFKIIM